MSSDQDAALRAADALAYSAAALLDHLSRNLNRTAEELDRALRLYQEARGEKLHDAA